MKPKRKPRKHVAHVVVPVEDLTYIEQAHKAIAAAWRRLKKRLK